ncbi:hypothetical protein CFN78_18655 [Amycolatopsis antarctica]|uniref:HTH cro/C1-type domain-containing protein n=1 Tax=Amycolatopsis antarctica TaxID=1854586 RepID=A0A263D160_9PSEU|nr:hypothetical protein CFN78_18655 [Amycolatopsis antarctica]
MSRRELAGFLRQRREALRPDDVGLPTGTRTRRTPGLRREEVAALAGISANYYERLEQKRAAHPAPLVLDALSRALRLSGGERAQLTRLASKTPAAGDDAIGETPSPPPDGERIVLYLPEPENRTESRPARVDGDHAGETPVAGAS